MRKKVLIQSSESSKADKFPFNVIFGNSAIFKSLETWLVPISVIQSTEFWIIGKRGGVNNSTE